MQKMNWLTKLILYSTLLSDFSLVIKSSQSSHGFMTCTSYMCCVCVLSFTTAVVTVKLYELIASYFNLYLLDTNLLAFW